MNIMLDSKSRIELGGKYLPFSDKLASAKALSMLLVAEIAAASSKVRGTCLVGVI